jgi:hypothetical protein
MELYKVEIIDKWEKECIQEYGIHFIWEDKINGKSYYIEQVFFDLDIIEKDTTSLTWALESALNSFEKFAKKHGE